MATNIRASKFRHIDGKEEQLRNCYNSVRLGTASPDSNWIRANSKFFAVPWAVKGSLCVQPLAKTGAVDHDELPLIIQDEEQNVNDFAFHPFNPHLVITASQDAKAYLWRIPEDGLTEHITTPEKSYSGHRSRLMLIDFHPLADNVLVTVGADKDIKIWDVETGEEKLTLPKEHRELIAGFTWNEVGSELATFAKDKKLRIFDPRGQALVADVVAHEGTKGGRVAWLNGLDKIVTTGFTRQSDKEVTLWDPRNLGRSLHTQKFDVGSSAVVPYYDEDTHILHLAGKGDGLIRMFEVVDEAPFFYPLIDYKSSKPQTGLAFFPKQMLNVMDCEINRILKLTTTDVLPVSFTIPRQNKLFFQDDLFPPTWDRQSTMTAEDWFGGASNPPNRVSLDPGTSS